MMNRPFETEAADNPSKKGDGTMSTKQKEVKEKVERVKEIECQDQDAPVTPILEEITIEELAVDGICGIY